MSGRLPLPLDLLDTTGAEYYCPGESHPISRSVHLARLASYYAGCRDCQRRQETGTLGRRQVEQLERVHRRRGRRSLFDAEGARGAYLNALSAADAQRIAAALGVWLHDQQAAALPRSVLLASDGGDLTPEIVARSSEGLRFAGCDVVDVGIASSPAVMFAQARLSAMAAIHVSQLTTPRDTIHIAFWGPGGKPLSNPGSLESLERIAERSVARPTRRYGGLSRCDVVAEYRIGLAEYYHGLRPLRLVVDCDCAALMADLSRLMQSVECEIVPATRTGTGAVTLDLGPQVRATQSHFGVQIRETGERIALWDESGKPAPGEAVLYLLAERIVVHAEHAEVKRRRVVVEPETQRPVLDRLRQLGFSSGTSGAGREAMHARLIAADALVGGGPSGRFWLRHGDTVIMPDALHALSLLLVIFSHSDRAVSQVLAAGLATDRPSR